MGPAELLRIDVEGIEGFLAAVHSLQGPELEQTAAASIHKASQRGGIPLVRSALRNAMQHPGSHREPRGSTARRGRGGPLEQNVTVRTIRKRRGEIAAMSLGPRAWWKHFFIGGTAPHVIEARDAQGNRADRGQVKTINRLGRGYYAGDANEPAALRVGNMFFRRVNHPGARATGALNSLGRPLGALVQAELTQQLLANVTRNVRRANARAAARRAARGP